MSCRGLQDLIYRMPDEHVGLECHIALLCLTSQAVEECFVVGRGQFDGRLRLDLGRITAYTTATDVVESATPDSQLAWDDHPRTWRAYAAHPRNGGAKLTRPMTPVSRHFVRSTAGSSSAPARKVRNTAPVAERNVIQLSVAPRSAVPTKASRIDISVAARASPCQSAARSQTSVMAALGLARYSWNRAALVMSHAPDPDGHVGSVNDSPTADPLL
jgi:hypothetical protein